MEFLTRSQQKTRTKRRKEHQMNRALNYLIALVSVLLVISLAVIFTTGDEEKSEEQVQTERDGLESENNPAEESENLAGAGEVQHEDENETEAETQQNETNNDATNEQSDQGVNGDVDINQATGVINASNDPRVAEVWTSNEWQPYPTAQTGEHRSTFAQGDIDYEEKLQSIYSVIPIKQQESIIWSVKNNGNAKSAIAVISSNDKTQKYRIAIEWVEQQGWKPVQVEVLNTLEGTY